MIGSDVQARLDTLRHPQCKRATRVPKKVDAIIQQAPEISHDNIRYLIRPAGPGPHSEEAAWARIRFVCPAKNCSYWTKGKALSCSGAAEGFSSVVQHLKSKSEAAPDHPCMHEVRVMEEAMNTWWEQISYSSSQKGEADCGVVVAVAVVEKSGGGSSGSGSMASPSIAVVVVLVCRRRSLFALGR